MKTIKYWMVAVVIGLGAMSTDTFAAPSGGASSAKSSGGARVKTKQFCWCRTFWTTCRFPRHDGWGRSRGYMTWACQARERVCVNVPVPR